MRMLEQKTGSDMGSNLPDAVFEQQQRRRMLVALAVLLLALISVLIKDRRFWFPSGPGDEFQNRVRRRPVPKLRRPELPHLSLHPKQWHRRRPTRDQNYPANGQQPRIRATLRTRQRLR
jgi:hypothetical protein